MIPKSTTYYPVTSKEMSRLMENKIPPIAFLGLCDDLRMVPATANTMPEMSLVGLKSVIGSYIFPLSLNHMFFTFSAYGLEDLGTINLSLKDPTSKEIFSLKVSMEALSSEEYHRLEDAQNLEEGEEPEKKSSPIPGYLWIPEGVDRPIWSPLPILPGDSFPPLLVYRPGIHTLYWKQNGEELPLGYLMFVEVVSPPLTPDRIAAIKAKPHAAKQIRASIGCRECTSEMKAYVGLEINAETEADGWIWYQNLPETFICE